MLADGNSEVSPGHPSSHPSNCLVEESSISLPLASNETNMDNAKSPGPNPDVSADEQKATKESNLTENGPPEEDSNNSDKKDLLQGQSSGNNILEIIEDMEKELLSNKEAIIALLNKSTLTLNRLSKIKSNI